MEQPLPEFGSCLLGSVILSKFVRNPFEKEVIEHFHFGDDVTRTDVAKVGAYFDWETFDKTVRTFVRMLDNVVELHGLALPEQAHEILYKRRHGMGYTGLGTALNMLGIKYGSQEAVEFCEEVTKRMTVINLEESYKLGTEKGCAPVFEDEEGFGRYLHWLHHPFTQRTVKASSLKYHTANFEDGTVAYLPELDDRPRFTHATSIAPTGCIIQGTKIVTDRGLLKIEELGDIEGETWQDLSVQVSTDSGYKEATKFFINGESVTIKLTTNNGRTVESTPKHQFKVLDRLQGYVWKRANEITVGDCIPSLVNNYPEKLAKTVTKQVELGGRGSTSEFKNPSYLSEGMATFIGFLHSNGNVKSDRHIRLYHHVDYADTTFKFLQLILKESFGVDSVVKKDSQPKGASCLELHIHSKSLVSWLELNGLSKTVGKHLELPTLIRQSDRSIIYAYLRGLYEGDGSNHQGSITYTCACEEFLADLQVLLQAVGIVAQKDVSVRVGSKGHLGGDIHRLSISNTVDRLRFIDKVGFISSKGNRPVESTRNLETRQIADGLRQSFDMSREVFAKFIARESSKVSEEILWEVVTDIQEGFADTYDISVPENVTYTANNFVSHNTISLAFGNNCSNGIEPSFSHSYFRNVIIPNKKTKKKVEVLSAEALAYRNIFGDNPFPKHFVTAQDITPEDHLVMQAAAQRWVDSSISKTINVPASISFEDFKNIYQRAYELGLKGCTTYRPVAGFAAVLQTSEHLEAAYEFTLENGEVVRLKASDKVMYDGEEHDVQNLYDALNEGYYGKF